MSALLTCILCDLPPPDGAKLASADATPGRAARGFTLIELLVVIAIIAILAAILFPVLARLKDRANQATCLSNLKQLGAAIDLYSQDSDDRFPYGIDWWDRLYPENWSLRSGYPWVNPSNGRSFYQEVRRLVAADPRSTSIDVVLSPYVKNDELWHCPGDVGTGGGGWWWAPEGTEGKSIFELYHMSYGYRTELALSQIMRSRVLHPSELNVLMDTMGYWHARFHRSPRQGYDDLRDERFWGFNVLFADGHVKNITDQALFDMMTGAWGVDVGYEPWAR